MAFSANPFASAPAAANPFAAQPAAAANPFQTPVAASNPFQTPAAASVSAADPLLPARLHVVTVPVLAAVLPALALGRWCVAWRVC